MEKQIKPCPFCGCIPEVKGDVVTHRHKDNICIVDDTQYGLEEWNKKPDGWISVKDRLPEDAMLYLCFGEIWYNKNIQQQFIRVVEYKNCKFRCDFNPCAYVTHWMPLPEPPK